MNAQGSLVLLLLASTPAWGQEQAPTTAEQLPEPIKKAFAATKDGAPVVPDSLQAYLRGQPENLRLLFAKKMEAGLIGDPEHVRILLALQLSGQSLQLLLQNNCILCHSDPSEQSDETLFVSHPQEHGAPAYMDLDAVVSSIHFRDGLSCAGCHGGSPNDEEMSDAIYDRWPSDEVRNKDRTWIPAFCAHCHADPAFMRRFAPHVPTDQLAKYRTSRHGQLLLEKHDSKAAQCVSCHGAHGIQSAKSPTSKVYPTNIPTTCGACHADPNYMQGYTVHGKPIPTNQVEDYKQSVHGQALFVRGDLGAPVCNDCHGDHAALPPQVSQVAQVCRTCHSAEANYFEASAHKDAFLRHGWAQCEKCHGKHLIRHPTDTMLANVRGTLCYDCHTVYAPNNPKCRTLPTYLHDRLGELEVGITNLNKSSTRLAERGLDVEELDATITEVGDALKNSRTRVHAFSQSTFAQTAQEGLTAVNKGRELVASLWKDYRFRTGGLIIAVVIMLALAGLLWWRLREIER